MHKSPACQGRAFSVSERKAPPDGRGANKTGPAYGRSCFLSGCKAVAQVLEEALALFVIVILQAVLKRLEGFPLGTVELFRDLHLDDHILVAAAAPVEVLDALPAQTELGAALDRKSVV